ncbi:PIN domain-containing protein [Methylopila sp. 73B]|uniref:type II toxin-antitoxin system VapC family toxin n=1 Tax=Methylopila sp. 73B TaxID=1120792 RepID=UPI0003661D69|nr:PIN domain-containing protein [Methylopila sp. 73B]
MILVDTSVWADHLGKPDNALRQLLDDGQVLMHPFVLGEIALGSLPKRGVVLSTLGAIDQCEVASISEVEQLIETLDLWETGVGYVDVHLIASTIMMLDGALWTRDQRLKTAAERLGVAAAGLV